MIASVLCSAQVCDMVLPLRQLRSGCHIVSSLHAVLALQVRPLEHHAGTLPRQGPCRHSVMASRHTRQTLHVQVSLHGPTLLQTPPASYLGASRLLPEATLLLAVRPDWRSVPTGVLSAHGLQRHSGNSQPSWPFFAVSVALPWLPWMPKPMRATRRHESADDLVEVEIEAAADEAAALISERQACASGSEIVLDPLAAGTEAVVVAGHRPELVGVRVMILPSTDLTSRNVRPLQGLQVQKMRTYTVDVQHLQSCTGLVADQDDGLHPSLRWRLRPPPLMLYSARWLLGWSSYATLVPPAAPKRDHHGHLLEPALELSLPEPWTGHRDPDTGRTFYYNKVTKDATWREPQAPLRLPMDVVLPEPWEAHRAQGTDWTFYYNRDTGESTWKHPQPSKCEDEEVEVEVEPDDVESSYPGETTGNIRGHKGYQSTDVDEHGRLRPRPKKRPAVLLPAQECELPHDATLEILAGDLVLKSVNAVASAGSSSGGSAPHKSQRRAKPSHPAARSAASPRPERVRRQWQERTSDGASNAAEKSATLYLVYGG